MESGVDVETELGKAKYTGGGFAIFRKRRRINWDEVVETMEFSEITKGVKVVSVW